MALLNPLNELSLQDPGAAQPAAGGLGWRGADVLRHESPKATRIGITISPASERVRCRRGACLADVGARVGTKWEHEVALCAKLGGSRISESSFKITFLATYPPLLSTVRANFQSLGPRKVSQFARHVAL